VIKIVVRDGFRTQSKEGRIKPTLPDILRPKRVSAP
jgi:hypothetical protein